MSMKRKLATAVLVGLLGLGPAPVASASGPYCNQIAIVGDSLTANGATSLHAAFPRALISGRGGRRTAEAWDSAAGIDGANSVDCWIFALGTNDLYGWHDWTSSRAAVMLVSSVVEANDHIWWILPQVAPWSGLRTATFDSAVPSFVGPVDLHTPLGDYLADGVHLTPAGYTHRAAAIAAAVAA